MGERRAWSGWLGVPPFVFLAVFFVIPIGLMLKESLFVPSFSLDKYGQLFSNVTFRRGLSNTLSIAAISTLVTFVLGVFMLAALRRWGKRRRAALIVALLVPFAASEVVRIVTWVVILGPTGPVEHVLSLLPWVHTPVGLVKNRTAIIIAIVNVILPVFVLTAYPAVRAVKEETMRAAEALGASPPVAMLAVFAPLAMPGLIAAGLISFVLTLGYYATPAALGGPGDVVFSTLIVTQVNDFGDTAQAAALGVTLLAITLVAMAVISRFGGLRMIYAGAGGIDGPRATSGGHRRIWLGIVSSEPIARFVRAFERVPHVGRALCAAHAGIVCLTVLFLIAPVAIVIPISLTHGTLLTFPPQGISTRWYTSFFNDPQWTDSFGTSVLIASVTALTSVGLGLAAATVLVRRAGRLRGPLLTFYLLPLIMPSIVTALGLRLLMIKLGIAFTTPGIIIGHVVFALPFAVIVLTAALQAFDWDVLRAAQASGARFLARGRDVMFPMLRPALLSALVFCFIVSFAEFTFAYLMRTLTISTLPVRLWDGINLGATPTTAAASGVILVVLGGVWLIYQVVRVVIARASRLSVAVPSPVLATGEE